MTIACLFRYAIQAYWDVTLIIQIIPYHISFGFQKDTI